MITKTYDDIPEVEVYRLYFRLVNAMIPSKKITEKKMNILIEFLLIKGDKYKHNRFGAKAKSIVIGKLKEKYDWEVSSSSLVLALLQFEKLGYIVKDDDGVKYFNKGHQKVINKIKTSNDFTNITFRIKMRKEQLV
tara:strand:- start:8 stop:415 length:408 start_codon:yes stop_codon:yes gene_type:complete